MKLADFLQSAELVQRICLDVIGNVYVRFHGFIIAVSRPFHYGLCHLIKEEEE